MDVANFTQEDIRRHLADLGYTNVTDEKLEGFVRCVVGLGVMAAPAPLWICSSRGVSCWRSEVLLLVCPVPGRPLVTRTGCFF